MSINLHLNGKKFQRIPDSYGEIFRDDVRESDESLVINKWGDKNGQGTFS